MKRSEDYLVLVATLALAGCSADLGAGADSVGSGASGPRAGGTPTALGTGGISNVDGPGPTGGGQTTDLPPPVNEEFTCNASAARPGPNLVRRLTGDEYIRTVRDLLNLDVSTDIESVPDLPPTAQSFRNNAVELSVSAGHVDAYASLAESIVGRIPSADSWVIEHAGCSDFGGTCAAAFIASLGGQLYRAPLIVEETTALLGIFETGQVEGASFVESALYVTQAMLQSPRFLYRIENETGDGSVRALSGPELANRLSYAVWGSAPDETLLQTAESGALATNEGVLTELDRMLLDERAEEAALAFLSDWFDMHRLDTFLPNPDEFPDFDPTLLPQMAAEAEATFAHVVGEQLPLSAMFDLQQTTVSRELAEFYAFSPLQDGVATYDLTSIPERGGILTQGAMHSIGGSESSTVRRGLFYLYQVLCGSMQPPPAGVDTAPPPVVPGKSIRDVSSERVETPACGGCHSQFEPLVWGMVRFDATGAYHPIDHYGNALPEDGYVMIPGEGAQLPYSTVSELMTILAESERVRDCSALKLFTYVMGRSVAVSDSCSLESARTTIVAEGASYDAMIRAIALSDNFRTIQTEAR